MIKGSAFWGYTFLCAEESDRSITPALLIAGVHVCPSVLKDQCCYIRCLSMESPPVIVTPIPQKCGIHAPGARQFFGTLKPFATVSAGRCPFIYGRQPRLRQRGCFRPGERARAGTSRAAGDGVPGMSVRLSVRRLSGNDPGSRGPRAVAAGRVLRAL